MDELSNHLCALSQDSSVVMLEEFLSGEEATVTVMPPSAARPEYWVMPIVSRFNHEAGVVPYNGLVAVTANSRVVDPEEAKKDARYAQAAKECEEMAQLLHATGPIRIDIRRFNEDQGSQFALFDINMKPVSYFNVFVCVMLFSYLINCRCQNMTRSGRPGRQDQACLTAMAATALGWDYSFLLRQLLETACSLKELRGTSSRLP